LAHLQNEKLEKDQLHLHLHLKKTSEEFPIEEEVSMV
jgi:hypothetical protein